ncbi:MAG: hypothetical protein WBD25_20065, partial [Terriglobales bacterium]
ARLQINECLMTIFRQLTNLRHFSLPSQRHMLVGASSSNDASGDFREATMKAKILLPLFVILIATFASAADRYVSNEFGFAASFPADVAHSQIAPDVSLFRASPPGGAWEAQVKVFRNVVMPEEISKAFMEAKLAEVLESGGMTQAGVSSYTKFQGHSTLVATATFLTRRDSDRYTDHVSFVVVVDIKLIFVKRQKRIYLVDGLAIEGKDRSGIDSFLDSFELR